jgi:hypothetical protein
LHDRQIRRLRPLQDATGINADLTIRIRNVGSVAEQPTGYGKVASPVYRRDRMARRQVDQLDTPIIEKGVAADEKRVRPLAYEGCEGRIDLAAGAGVENLNFASRWCEPRNQLRGRALPQSPAVLACRRSIVDDGLLGC